MAEHLTSIFVDFQIPSDLLSYDGPPDTSMAEKVETVKRYVQNVINVIEASKQKQLEEEKLKASTRKAMMHQANVMMEEDFALVD